MVMVKLANSQQTESAVERVGKKNPVGAYFLFGSSWRRLRPGLHQANLPW